jgi:hypothetical protein
MSTDVASLKAQEAANVWALEVGEVRKPGIIHLVMMLLCTGIGLAVTTFGTVRVSSELISVHSPAQAIQAAGAIWFGMWGGIAAFVFPLLSTVRSGEFPLAVSIALIPGYFVQGMAAGWAFRHYKCHPALKSGKDWMVWTFIGVLAANALGVLWTTSVQRIFGLIETSALPHAWADQFLGDSIASWILGILLLKFISPLVIKTRAFCKGYWA